MKTEEWQSMGDMRVAAWCGVLSGIGLAMEAALFLGSGWTVAAFSTLDGAAAKTADGGLCCGGQLSSAYSTLPYRITQGAIVPVEQTDLKRAASISVV